MYLRISIFLLAIVAIQTTYACYGACKGCMCNGDCGSTSACHGFAPNCYCLALNRMTIEQRRIHDFITNICVLSQNSTQPLLISIFNRDDQKFMLRCQNGTIGGFIV